MVKNNETTKPPQQNKAREYEGKKGHKKVKSARNLRNKIKRENTRGKRDTKKWNPREKR